MISLDLNLGVLIDYGTNDLLDVSLQRIFI